MTYTALASLVILGDDLRRVDVSHITAGKDRVPSVAALANIFFTILRTSTMLAYRWHVACNTIIIRRVPLLRLFPSSIFLHRDHSSRYRVRGVWGGLPPC